MTKGIGGRRRSGFPRGWLALAVVVGRSGGVVRTVAACDLCAIYSATELRESRRGLQLGVGQQFTRFEDLKRDGKSVDNPEHEYLNSSITQLLVGYNIDARWGVQLNLPIISRTFRRAVGDGVERDDETGVGDLSLIGQVRPYSRVTADSVLTTTLFGGLKLPSGSADRLREEREEAGGHDGAHGDEETSGIHGHDLALGSGSVDGVIGGRVLLTWKRFLWTTTVQYLMRTEGSHDYRYANDVIWRGGPGAFLLLDDRYVVTVQLAISGERKGRDELDGGSVGDTRLTLVALGPALSFTWGTSLAVDIGADIPVVRDNSGLQIVPEYRLRGGVSWRF